MPRPRDRAPFRSPSRALLALVVTLAAVAPVAVSAALDAGADECGESGDQPLVDEYGLPLDPTALIPCDELALLEASPPAPEQPELTLPPQQVPAVPTVSEWVATTGAALIDEFFQAILVGDAACRGIEFLSAPYDGELEVAAGATWSQAATSAVAGLPDRSIARDMVSSANGLFAAAEDCELGLDPWIDERAEALELIERVVNRLDEARAA